MAFLNEQGLERLWQHVVAKIEDSGGTTIPITTERPADLPANSLWFDTDEPTPEGGTVELPVATTDELGGIKSGGDITVSADGIVTVNKASISNYAAIIGTTWTGSTAPYTQEIAVNGMVADDTPIVDLIMSGTYATDEIRLTEWGKIYRIVTAENKIIVYAKEVTTAELPIQLQVVR